MTPPPSADPEAELRGVVEVVGVGVVGEVVVAAAGVVCEVVTVTVRVCPPHPAMTAATTTTTNTHLICKKPNNCSV
jgi:hypothetical protein